MFDAVGQRSALQEELDTHDSQVQQLMKDRDFQMKKNEEILKKIEEVEFGAADARRLMQSVQDQKNDNFETRIKTLETLAQE